VIGEAGDDQKLWDVSNSLKPDLLIIDLCAPAIDWPKAIEQIRMDHPQIEDIDSEHASGANLFRSGVQEWG
jgi:DNA-binding NarL/FixJ family response regulator